jgi:DNA-binding MarR family transcriptional regulator
VERTSVEGDRRSIRLSLTKAGQQTLRTVERAMAEVLDRIFDEARDRDALVLALADLDDALTARMRARLRPGVGA